MTISTRLIQTVGGLVFLVGLVGVFARISDNDGALAIAGGVVFASGVIADALRAPK
jgi:hypothetical protein